VKDEGVPRQIRLIHTIDESTFLSQNATDDDDDDGAVLSTTHDDDGVSETPSSSMQQEGESSMSLQTLFKESNLSKESIPINGTTELSLLLDGTDEDDVSESPNRNKIVEASSLSWQVGGQSVSVETPPEPLPPPGVITAPRSQCFQHASFVRCCQHLRKWGIPFSPNIYKTGKSPLDDQTAVRRERQVLEQILKKRLVWIRYRGRYLWPAILYDNYRQLIHDEHLSVNVWYRIPLFWKRIDVATMLVWNTTSPRNNCRVVRLLGRGHGGDYSGLTGQYEIVELVDGDNAFWCLGDASKMNEAVNDMALNWDFFRNDPSLYLDWHLAMDQMELLLSQCLGLLSGENPEELADEIQTPGNDSSTTRNQDCRGPTDDSDLSASPIQRNRQRHEMTWVQRAKDAENQRMVERCNNCSLTVLENLHEFCAWKDNVVAGCTQHPMRKDRKKSKRIMEEEMRSFRTDDESTQLRL